VDSKHVVVSDVLVTSHDVVHVTKVIEFQAIRTWVQIVIVSPIWWRGFITQHLMNTVSPRSKGQTWRSNNVNLSQFFLDLGTFCLALLTQSAANRQNRDSFTGSCGKHIQVAQIEAFITGVWTVLRQTNLM